MIVYGGIIDNGTLCNEIICFDLENHKWKRITPKNTVEAIAYAASAVVTQKQGTHEDHEDHHQHDQTSGKGKGEQHSKLPDETTDYIYLFGGKTDSG